MADYMLNRYRSSLQRSTADAQAALKEFLDQQDKVANQIVAMGIMPVPGDRESCVAWALLTGMGLFKGVHGHVADNLALTQEHDLVVANAAHVHAAGAANLIVPITVAGSAHAHAAGAVVLLVIPAVAGGAHGLTSENLTLT